MALAVMYRQSALSARRLERCAYSPRLHHHLTASGGREARVLQVDWKLRKKRFLASCHQEFNVLDHLLNRRVRHALHGHFGAIAVVNAVMPSSNVFLKRASSFSSAIVRAWTF